MAEKTIDIASPILSRNERLADRLRQRFAETNTYVINVLSSPGSGKTTTILGTNERLRDKAGLRCAVIEGDIASDVDAITMKEAAISSSRPCSRRTLAPPQRGQRQWKRS